jgi:hypothetical protein
MGKTAFLPPHFGFFGKKIKIEKQKERYQILIP